jgi:ribonuclease J
VAVVHRDHATGQLAGQPDILTKGFIYANEAQDIINGATDIITRLAQDSTLSDKALRERISGRLSEYLYHETKRRPMIIPVLS